MAAFRSASKNNSVSRCWAQHRAVAFPSPHWTPIDPDRQMDVLPDTIRRREIQTGHLRPTIIIAPATDSHISFGTTATGGTSITAPTAMVRRKTIAPRWVSRGDSTLTLKAHIWVIALNRSRKPN